MGLKQTVFSEYFHRPKTLGNSTDYFLWSYNFGRSTCEDHIYYVDLDELQSHPNPQHIADIQT